MALFFSTLQKLPITAEYKVEFDQAYKELGGLGERVLGYSTSSSSSNLPTNT